MQVRAQDTIQVFLRTSTVQPHLREPRPHRSRVPTEVLQSAEGRAPEVRPVETEASAASLRYRRSEKTTLQIRTQEGDVVRIKFQARESLRVKAERGGEADPESTELELSARSSSKLSIKTQGHLNAGELAAIRDAVDQATQIADGFFAGDLQAAFETASAFDVDGEQLARVKLKLRVRERVAYTAQGFTSVQAKIGPGEGKDTEAPSRPELATTPVAVPQADPGDPVGTAPPTTESAGAAPAPTEISEEMPVAGPETGADPPALFNVLQAIGDFLGLILDPLSAVGGERSADSLHLSLKIRIVQSTILTLSEARADEEAPLPALVTETLDALALQEQAPVDQVA